MTAIQILNQLEENGAVIWVDGEQLRYRAPKGMVDKAVLAQMSSNKQELIRLLQARSSSAATGHAEIIPDLEHRYEPFPLTDLQTAYFIGRSETFTLGNIACHVYVEFDKNNLNIERFNNALNALVQRHEMLRAVILPDGSQRILPDAPPYTATVTDLRSCDQTSRHASLSSLRGVMSHHVFQTDAWPLFDLRVSLLPNDVSRIHFGIDQLIADAFSIQILFRELSSLYEAPESALPPLGVSFRDYVLAVRRLETTPEYKRSREYWLNRVTTLPPAPELPLAKDPNMVQAPKFSYRRFYLDSKDWSQLKNLAAETGLTTAGILLSVYSEIISTWSKSARFTLNVTVFNRLPLHRQIMNIIGEFTTVALLEVDNAVGRNFIERAKNIQRQLWEDMDHRYFDGIKVIREIGKMANDPSGASMPVVFTSTIGVSSPNHAAKFNWKSLGELACHISQTPQVWLDNQVAEIGEELMCNWDAVEELFPEGMLDDMFQAYKSLLLSLVHEKNVWKSECLQLLPKHQKDLSDSTNATDTEISQETLQSFFSSQASATPDTAAIRSVAKQMSYKELDQCARSIATMLQAEGVRPGNLVAVVMDKGWEQVAAVIGVLYAGAAYMPVSPDVPAERLRLLVHDAGSVLALTQPWLSSSIVWPKKTRVLPVGPECVRTTDPEAHLPAYGPDALAYVIYTSGSTGVPKGVAVNHRGAVNTILDVNKRFSLGAQDITLAVSHLNFDLSVYDIFGTLAYGGTLVLPDAEKDKDPGHWLDLVNKYGVTVWNSVPALMQLFVEHMESVGQVADSLRLVMLSGDWIPLDLPGKIRTVAPQARVISLGGATESSIWSILYPIDEVDAAWKSVPYGYPMANQRMYVLNELMEECPVWVTGYLYIGGIGLAEGYWRDEEKTAASFIFHPHSRERLYRTGDLGRRLPDGSIEFQGREDSQVKIHGHRIELGEIEHSLQTLPGVRSAAVTVVKDSSNASRLVGHLVCDAESFPALVTDEGAGLGNVNEIEWHSLLCAARTQAKLMPAWINSIQEFLEYWDCLDAISLAYMCSTLSAIGIFPALGRRSADEIMAKHPINPAHKKLLIRWLNALSREGLLERVGRHEYARSLPFPEYATESVWQKTKTLGQGLGETGRLIEFMENSCNNLAKLFSGEISPQKLLFPDGSWDVAESVYQYNPMSLYYYEIMRKGVSVVSEWKNRGGAPVRILELGAGVGAATAVLLPELDPRLTAYMYTDISAFFLNAAREKFREYSFMAYGIFDINKSPWAQGYEPHSYDIIVANNVLHNAPDISASVGRLSKLLDAGGCLMILEQTRDCLPLMMTMEFLINLSDFEDERVQKDSPFLSEERWADILTRHGLTNNVAFPPPGHPCDVLGQHFFIAQTTVAPTRIDVERLRKALGQKLPEYMIPSHFRMLDVLPLTPTGKVDRKRLTEEVGFALKRDVYKAPDSEIEKALAGIWGEVLCLEHVGIDENFFELGGDSLLMTKMLSKMRERLGSSIDWEKLTLRKLFEKPTIAGLAESIEAQLQQNVQHNSSMVAMRPGGSLPPLFLVSDGRGRLFAYNDLVGFLDAERPIYGLQVPDMAEYVASRSPIEELAKEYIRAVRQVQPYGPYRIGGFCMGGILAYEMSQQLMAEGESIALAALISSMKPPFIVDDEVFIFFMLCNELRIPLHLREMDLKEDEFADIAKILTHWDKEKKRQGFWMDELNRSAHASFFKKYEMLKSMEQEERLRIAYALAVENAHRHITRMTVEEFNEMYEVFRTSVIAVANYQPTPFEGPLLVVRPERIDASMSGNLDIAALWREVGQKNMQVVDVPGTHVSCLEQHNAAIVAQALDRILRAHDNEAANA